MNLVEHGPQDAPAVVFLHGVAVGGWMWQSQVPAFQDFHCLLVDLPGHGKSNHLEWVSIEDTADQVVQMIRERTSLQRAHLVGASLGGSVAFEVLRRNPEAVDHAFITGASLLPMPGSALFKVAIRLMAPMIKSEIFLRAALKALNFSDGDGELFRQALRAVSSRTFVSAWSQSLDLRTSPELERVKTPVLLVAGEKEQSFIHQSNSLLAGKLSNARSRMVPGMGHGWMGESPPFFNRVLRAWLTDAELPNELISSRAT